jgi:lantibiotic biosynthesis protein
METLTIDKEIIDKRVKSLISIIENTEDKNDSLLSGQIGKILYYFYLFRYFEEDQYADKGVEILENVLHNIETKKSSYLLKFPFGSGMSGLGFVISLLKDEGIIDIDFENQLISFDEIVYIKALEEIAEKNTDYLYGAMGVFLYLSRRLSNPKVEGYLEEMIDALTKTAIEDERGIRFENSLIAKSNKTDNTNFGLAHGQCGILMILLKVHAQGICENKIERIVARGIDYLISYKTPQDFSKDKYSFFPMSINENQSWDSAENIGEYGSRLGWCYGDLNEILLLLTASKQFKKPEWAEMANEMGYHTLDRKTRRETKIIDAHICHGSVGMAQFYKRFYELTTLPMYAEAHEYWIERTLDFLDKETQDPAFIAHANELLEGFVGISLGLISSVAQENLKWDSVFLLS